MPSIKVNVNSYYRDTTDPETKSSTQFKYNFGQYLPAVKSVALEFISIPLSVYTITTSNNVLYFSDNGTNKSCTISVGNYDASTLASTIASAMTTGSGFQTYTVSYSSSTYKFTFSAGAVFTLRWSQNSSMAKLLGFTATDTSSSTSITSTQSANFTFPLAMFLSIKEFDQMTYIAQTAGTATGTCFAIQAANGPAYVNGYQPQKDVVVTFSVPVRTRTLTVSLRDIDGNLIDLNNVDWLFGLICETD